VLAAAEEAVVSLDETQQLFLKWILTSSSLEDELLSMSA